MDYLVFVIDHTNTAKKKILFRYYDSNCYMRNLSLHTDDDDDDDGK